MDVIVSMELAPQLSSSGRAHRFATENQRQGNQGTCFRCGKAGHQAPTWIAWPVVKALQKALRRTVCIPCVSSTRD
jgi:hypothetical protein